MKETIIDYVQSNLIGGSDSTVTETDDLLGSGLVDSMGMMSLIGFIENEFELKVPPEDMTIENFMTIGAIGDYLQRRKSN